MLKILTVTFLLAFASINYAQAQSAVSKIQELKSYYSAIPNYKLNIVYESVNDRMGFSNTQEGVLVVEGERYILNFGNNATETWMSDGKVEHVGTIEEDHSQYMRFCDGKNSEAIIDFGSILTFYGKEHFGTWEDGMLILKPTVKSPYLTLEIEVEGKTINSIKAIDDFGTSHKYTLSGFSVNTAGTKFTINPNRYFEKIDERGPGCK